MRKILTSLTLCNDFCQIYVSVLYLYGFNYANASQAINRIYILCQYRIPSKSAFVIACFFTSPAFATSGPLHQDMNTIYIVEL